MTPEMRFYGRLLMRRAPAMLLLFLICAAIGMVLATRLPTVYQSSARMLVQSQQISERLAETTVQIAALEEAEILREQLMTRANLIDIANDFDVFEDIRGMSPDEVVAEMRAATQIDAEGGDSRRTGPMPVTMTVSFRARTGQIAADVVNEYVTRITAENVRLRTGQAEETLEFFEREVDRLGTELDLRSARITDFQRENADALPDDQDFRLQRQSLLQERLAAAERERRALIETRARTIQVFEATGSVGGGLSTLSPEQQELRALEGQLADLLLTFSENAPQVQQVRRRIAQLETRIASQAPLVPDAPGDEDDDTGTAPLDDTAIANPLLAVQLAEIDSRIATLDTLIADTEAEIAELEAAISQAPLNAIALQQLQRDYDNVQLQYDAARQSLAQARIGEVIETGGRGRRISLLEPAVVPSSPASPNRPMIAAAGVGAGLALAAALFVLLELLNRSVRRPAEITRALGITPLATVPYIESASRRIYRRVVRLAAVILVLVGVPAALWAVDQYYLPLDLLAERILDRLGIA